MNIFKLFFRGIYPKGNKERTKDLSVINLPPPKTVKIPVLQGLGAPSEIIIKPGDKVKKGTLIAKKASDKLSANIHSPVSGTVIGISRQADIFKSFIPHIEIENDFKGDTEFLPEMKTVNRETVTERIAEAGIVGMGGAGFPTERKISSDEIDYLIINCAECEPYLTCDRRVIIENTAEVLQGAKYLQTAYGAKQVIFGIEDDKADAAEKLQALTNQFENFSIKLLKTKYPQGAERQLVYMTTGRKIPLGKLPKDARAAVNNVQTALNVYYAVKENKPLYERTATVTGNAALNPFNAVIPIGTPFSYLAEIAKVDKNICKKIIIGGPLMGFAVTEEEHFVTKTTSGVLFLTESEINNEKTGPCIGCSKCVQVCPMKLVPIYIDNYSLLGDFKNAKKYGADYCIECGACAYICPAKRPLVQSIKTAKRYKI